MFEDWVKQFEPVAKPERPVSFVPPPAKLAEGRVFVGLKGRTEVADICLPLSVAGAEGARTIEARLVAEGFCLFDKNPEGQTTHQPFAPGVITDIAVHRVARG